MATLALKLEILGEFQKLTKATQGAESTLKGLQNQVGKFASNIGRIAGTLGIAFGFSALVNGAKESVQAASDLEQQFGALDSIFKVNAEEMKVFSKEMQSIGISSADAARQSSLIGSLLKGNGLTIEDTADKTKNLVKLAGDLAATFGGPTSEAVNAISSLLKGERDPIERYGVSLKQLDVNARMLEDSKNGLVFASEKEASINATLALLYEKTADAQGQALRESETFAGVTGRLDAAFKNLQAEMGEGLLPTLSLFAGFLEDSIPKINLFFEQLYDPTTDLGNAWADLGAIFNVTAQEFNKMLAVFGVSGIEFKDVLNFVTTLTAGFGQLFFMVGRVADIIGSLITFNFQRAFDLAMSFGDDFGSLVSSQNAAIMGNMSGPLTPVQADRVQNVTINVNNGNITAQEIADKINRGNRSTGTNLIRAR
jgi:hypothetical protein